jgi:hypothetical protein
MTEKAKRQDREDAREDRERLSAEISQELAPETAAQDELTEAAPTEGDRAQAVDATPRPRARRTTRKSVSAEPTPVENAATRAQEQLAVSALEADAMELEAQGFSSDEAQRLIDMSKRLETSAEARASQAELKRLRFAQWLIERGILNEFSA